MNDLTLYGVEELDSEAREISGGIVWAAVAVGAYLAVETLNHWGSISDGFGAGYSR